MMSTTGGVGGVHAPIRMRAIVNLKNLVETEQSPLHRLAL